MKISYKAAYTLLEGAYARRSLNEYVETDIPQDIYRASILFAKENEDYRYLSVMIDNREKLNNEYAFFYNFKHELPIVLKKDTDLTLLEFALLYNHSSIHIAEFKTVVEATAENSGLIGSQLVIVFENLIEKFQKEPQKINK